MAIIRQITSRLWTDRRGTSVIEMGLALPILSLMLVNLIDVASAYSAQMSLQQAAARSLERLQVSGYPESFNFVRAEAAAAAGVAESKVTITTWLECNNVRQPASVTVCSGTAVAGKYVDVAIASTYDPFFSISLLGERDANGDIALSARSSVRFG